MSLPEIIALGAYAFAAGAYVFAWAVSRAVTSLAVLVAALTGRLENHFTHTLAEIKKRLDDLEQR